MRFFRVVAILGIVFFLLASLSIAAIVNCFRLNKDTRTSRTRLMQQFPNAWTEVVELRIGSVPWKLAHLGLRFMDLPDEARTVLESVQDLEFGFYQSRKPHPNPTLSSPQILHAADETMHRRGFARTVVVIHDTDLVAVYLSQDSNIKHGVSAKVIMVHEGQLILAAGHARVDRIITMLAEKLSSHSVKNNFL